MCIEVYIGVCRDCDGAVSKPTLDFLDVLAVGQHKRCTGVAKVMESDFFESMLLEQYGEVVGYIVGLEEVTHCIDTDIFFILSVVRSTKHLLHFFLAFSFLAEFLTDEVNQRQASH